MYNQNGGGRSSMFKTPPLLWKHSFHCSYFSYEGTHTNTTHMTRTTMIYYQGKKIWWTVFWGIFWISKLDPHWRNFGSLEHQQLYLSRDWSSSIQGNLRGAFCLQLPLSPCRFHKEVSRTGGTQPNILKGCWPRMSPTLASSTKPFSSRLDDR